MVQKIYITMVMTTVTNMSTVLREYNLFIIYGVVSNQFCHSNFLSFTLACIQAPSWSSSIAMSEFLRVEVKNIVTSDEGNR